MKLEMAVVAGDLQIPYHSKRAVATFTHFLRAHKSQITSLILNGDVYDFPYLSLKFARPPDVRFQLKKDLARGRELLGRLCEAVPSADKWFIMGNHEERYRKYIEQEADELAELDELDFRVVTGLDEMDFEVVGPYSEGLDWHGLFVTHGTRISAHSGYTARMEYLAAGTSGISGHTQRGGVHFHTDRSGAHAWYEGFCLCNTTSREGVLPPGPTDVGIRNQQQGFLVVEWAADKSLGRGELWNVTPICMTNQSFIYNGRLYTPEGVLG